MKSIVLSLAAVVFIGIAGMAQVLNAKTISLDGSKKVVAEAVKFARDNKAPGGAIAVVDAGGSLVYLERLDNTFPAASEVAIKKANTSAGFKAPSSKLENAI